MRFPATRVFCSAGFVTVTAVSLPPVAVTTIGVVGLIGAPSAGTAIEAGADCEVVGGSDVPVSPMVHAVARNVMATTATMPAVRVRRVTTTFFRNLDQRSPSSYCQRSRRTFL